MKTFSLLLRVGFILLALFFIWKGAQAADKSETKTSKDNSQVIQEAPVVRVEPGIEFSLCTDKESGIKYYCAPVYIRGWRILADGTRSGRLLYVGNDATVGMKEFFSYQDQVIWGGKKP